MNVAWLLEAIRKLGPKLPQAWPHLLHIVADLQAIVAIMNDGQRPVFGAGARPSVAVQSEDTAELVRACETAGVDPAECENVIHTFQAAERAVAA